MSSSLQSSSFFYTFASLSGATAITLGAIGSHALRNKISAYLLEMWQTGVSYQLIHSLALLYATSQPATQGITAAKYLFTTGITLFSGSIYGLVLTSPGNSIRKVLGPITPIGGTAFIFGWLALAAGRRGGVGSLRLN